MNSTCSCTSTCSPADSGSPEPEPVWRRAALPADGAPPGLLLSGRRRENESTVSHCLEPLSTSRFPLLRLLLLLREIFRLTPSRRLFKPRQCDTEESSRVLCFVSHLTEHHWVLGKVLAPSLTACLLEPSHPPPPTLMPALHSCAPCAQHTRRKGHLGTLDSLPGSHWHGSVPEDCARVGRSLSFRALSARRASQTRVDDGARCACPGFWGRRMLQRRFDAVVRVA